MSALRLSNSTFDYEDGIVASASRGIQTVEVKKNISDGAVESATSDYYKSQRIRLVQPLPVTRTLDLAYRPFVPLQQWEGRVTRVIAETFVAILDDKTTPENAPDQVEIELSEISEEDQKLVKVGAFFYWSVGYEQGPGIPRQRVSRIRFRRLPGWTMREVELAKKNAAQYADLF